VQAERPDLFARITRIGSDPADDDDLRLRKSLAVLVVLMILPVSLIWGSIYLALGSSVGYVPFIYFVIAVGALLVFARTHDFGLFLNIQLADILLAPTLSAIPLGGFVASSGVGLWGVFAPIGAVVFADLRSGMRWMVAFLVAFIGAGLVGELSGFQSPLPAWFTSTMVGLNIALVTSIVFILIAVFVRQRQEALSELRIEQDKAENLLLNVLPRSIADRLRADAEPQTIADHYDEATILFADVVDFTPFAQRLSAREVVDTLDGLFSRFDELAERYDLEKIKTIGDCYMVAAGVPTPRADHAVAIAHMALDMLDVMSAHDAIGRLGLELRIGINSGPVVAGVIGRKRFLYDMWGDAVNIASRMESHGTPGHIQVTVATHELLENDFEFEHRGPVEVKGKGEMDTWYLVGSRSRPAGESAAAA
jgi:adenylate cyclase